MLQARENDYITDLDHPTLGNTTSGPSRGE